MHDIDWSKVGWLVGLVVCLVVTVEQITQLNPTLGLLYTSILGTLICGYKVYDILTRSEDDT